MAAENARTLGEFLARRHQGRCPVRARNRPSGQKAEYDFYPTRELLIDEFDKIWNEQSKHHSSMTPKAHDEIEHIIFYQRALKPPVVGKCALDPARPFDEAPEGYRAPWAHPLAQRFRIQLERAEPGRPAIA